MTTAAIFGSTGAIGSNILSTLLTTSTPITSIKTISRRLPQQPTSPTQIPKLESILEPSTEKWTPTLKSISPQPTILFNAIGTTRSQAGSLSNQWKIDHDLCIEIANAAKQSGVKTMVFISSAGTRGFLTSYVPYSKMKIGVEDTIQRLDFDHAIILRPGMILGNRETSKAPWLEMVISNLGRVSVALRDMIGQDQKIIARAAVAAALLAQEGKLPSRYTILDQADIVKYGRDEWKE